MSLHTEAQARELWCPFARVARVLAETGKGVPTVVSACNRSTAGNATELSRCLANRCMAWRERIEPHPDPKLEMTIVVGYCGLAGAP